MTVREFDGIDDTIIMSLGGAAGMNGGPITTLHVYKSNGFTAQGLWSIRAATAPRIGVNPFSDSNEYFSVDNGASFNGQPYSEDEWLLTGWTKGNGNSMLRRHKCVLTSESWIHINTINMVDATGGPNVDIAIGRFGYVFEILNGRLAAIAIYDNVLSDEQIESARVGIWAMLDLSPLALWRFNQSNTGTTVIDLTGNGADQTSITGTTVVNGDDPPGFSFSETQPVSSDQSSARRVYALGGIA